MSDFVQLFDTINEAGYGYKSEWLGGLQAHADGTAVARFTVYKGKRKKGEWIAPNPGLAAEKACKALGIAYDGEQLEMPL